MKPVCRGFTLLEVLVALAVLAIALTAALAAAQRNAETASSLYDRVLAQWVAADRLTELQLGLVGIVSGRTAGSTQMDGRNFEWTATGAATADSHVARLEVEVDEPAQPSRVLAALTGYRYRSPSGKAP